MYKIVSASLTTLLMMASASPLLAHDRVSAATSPETYASATGPMPTDFPGCPPTTGRFKTDGQFKRCNDTKRIPGQFTPLLDLLR